MKIRAALALVISLLTTPVIAWTHGNGAATYDGLVATRGSAPSGKRAETQAMSRLASFTRGAVTQIKLIIPNWYNGEVAPGSTATVTASIEYPAGVCTQLTWSSATSVVAPDGGQVTSDYVNLVIPTNTQFWIREYITNAGGVPFASFQGQDLSLGDALVVGNSGVVDQTVSCDTVVDGGTFASIAPLAIIAPITAPSVCILGDSIALGVDNDHTPNSVGDSGSIAPSIGPSFGYSLLAVNGEYASQYVSTHTNRNAVLPYCTTVIVEYGTNDIYLGGDSVAALQSNLTTIYGYAIPKTVFQTTLIARTNSSDFWATTAGQSTITAGGEESRRVAFNTALTSASFGPNGGFFDMQSVVGTSTNNSIWKAGNPGFAPCVPNWTTDGVHPNTCSYYSVIQNSGYIDLSSGNRLFGSGPADFLLNGSSVRLLAQ